MDIGQNTPIGNSNINQKLAKLFIIPHSQLNVPLHYAILLVVPHCIPSQFQHLCSEIFKNSSEINQSSGTNMLGVLSSLEESSDSAERDLEVGTKLSKEGDDQYVDSTHFKQIVGSLSDWGGDLDDRKSTSGYCFMLGTTACSWSSKKQSIVALSTCEAEYVATASSACQAIWLKNVMNQIHFPVQGPMKIYVDNVSAINLAKNPVTHGRSKHIDIRYHFLRDQVEKRIIELVYCKSEDQLADIFTKSLKHEAFDKFKKIIGVAVLQHQN
nr:Retrovirus-related Pol polyprotein from transposon TNT 1-94 [Ipomoea batatas]